MAFKLLWSSAFFSVAAAAVVSSSPSVTVEAGTIKGGTCGNGKNGIYFKGIPFAEPPVGHLRFEPPQTYGKYHNGEFDASSPAPVCIQFGPTFAAQGPASEDCLNLNIFTPANATKDSKLPVKVWVYGGSNTDGGINDSLYDGCNIADDGSILVSINYRLGPLGFLALNSAGIYGNQGIQDLLLGLQWVQDSIAAFGGDPKKVVLFGQSAGATDVFTIATLPQAPSLFNSAIAESIALPSLSANATLQKTGASYAQTLKCEIHDKSCLQSKSVADLKGAFSSNPFQKTGLGSGPIGISTTNSHKFWPYVDDNIITENPVTRGRQVPLIVGYNQFEGMMDTLSEYNSVEAAKSATPAAYTEFLRRNFGPAAGLVEKYYNLSLFKDSPLPVIGAIATVVTDAQFKCPGYASTAKAAHSGIPAWVYEFTHNSTCVWLDTMPQEAVSVFHAAHTAEIPYIFGNLHFDFHNSNTTCTGTAEEMKLSKQMRGLWTAMAENADPSTDDIHWPQFQTSKDFQSPGMIFGNSSTAGKIDFSACELWSKVYEMLVGENSTATATPTGGAKPTTPPKSGAVRMFSTAGSVAILSAVLSGVVSIV